MIPVHSVSMLFTLPFTPALPISAEPDVCANSLTMATHVLSFSYDRLSRSIRDDHHCSLTQVALSSQQLIRTLPPHPETPISDSKHIILVGGFDQPTLSLVLRPRRSVAIPHRILA